MASPIVDFPAPTAADGWNLVRDLQAEIVASEPNTHLAAYTKQYGPEDYIFEPGIGQIHFLPATYRLVADELAQTIKDVFATFPNVSPLKPDADAYWFIGDLYPDPVGLTTPVNHATVKFFERFFELLKSFEYSYVNSVAYEILDFFCPPSWKQMNWMGQPAQSGWVPPSSFIQPTNQEPLDYLSQVQIQFLEIAVAKGLDPKFQIGEPWWWDGSYNNGAGKNAPCLYDSHTMALYTAETGQSVPLPMIKSIFDPVEPHQWPYVDWLCTKLGVSTNHIRDKVKAAFPASEATLLFFTPQIMSPASELTYRLNFPITEWTYPNYEFVQIEDYDWIIDGRLDLVPQTFTAATEILKYPLGVVHYFLGFVLLPSDAKRIWGNVDKALGLAMDAKIPHTYLWSYTQVIRDGVVFSNQNACGC